MMKHCNYCNRTYTDDRNYCTECGRPLVQMDEQSSCNLPDKLTKQSVPRRSSMLRKLVSIFVILILGAVGLFNYLENLTTTLSLSPVSGLVYKCGGSVEVSVVYDGVFWKVIDSPEWVEINEDKDSFEVIVAPNETGQKRVGTIVVKSGKLTARAIIVQGGFASFLQVNHRRVYTNKEGGTVEIQVQSDGVQWQAEYPDFIAVEKADNNGLRLHVQTNNGYVREGYVTLKEDYQKVTIQVLQGGICSSCQGTGEVVCPYCNGISHMDICPYCRGTGKILCRKCKGNGEFVFR